MVILLMFQMACEKEAETPITEMEELRQLLLGKWEIDSMKYEDCQISTNQCNINMIPLDPNSNYFEFSYNSVIFNFWGVPKFYLLEIPSPDTLLLKEHFLSEIFIIKEMDENFMVIEFYMDHSSNYVDDDHNLTDNYFLRKK